MKYDFNIANARFHLTQRDIYILRGWFPKNNPKHYSVKLMLDNMEVSFREEVEKGPQIRKKYLSIDDTVNEELVLYAMLPDNLDQYQKLYIYTLNGEEKSLSHSFFVKRLIKQQEELNYHIDEVKNKENGWEIKGWAVDLGNIEFKLLCNGKEIPFEIESHNRTDVQDMFSEADLAPDCGFVIRTNEKTAHKLQLQMMAGKYVEKVSLSPWLQKTKKYGANKLIQKSFSYLKHYGIKQFLVKVKEKLLRKNSGQINYNAWRQSKIPTQEQLKKQREKKFDYTPKFSIVVPLYKTPLNYLDEFVKSVTHQTYKNWELCLSDGSGENSPLEEALKSYTENDSRIKVVYKKEQLRISANTNEAIKIAAGDYIVFADHDDILAPDALYECAKALNQNPETDVIYTDEDKIDMNGKKYFEPHFKSDFNIDLLCSMNYICHMFVVKKEIADKVGMLREEFDGAQDYDFVLRCVEQTDRIVHIPKALYHWRAHADSTAENPESKRYAFDAGRRAVEAHYERVGLKAKVEDGEYPGLYKTKFVIEGEPLISVIIPNKDHTDELDTCIRSIEEKSTYRNFEILVIENNSELDSTFEYYKSLEVENPKVRVVYYEGKFNYSAINNFGVSYASGEYLLLLNNDTEMINEDCLEHMLGYCQREDVGIVGARLYYEDDTIQHAGVLIGNGGIAGHNFLGMPRSANGYFSRIICAQDYSAVTAACLMVKKSVFEQVGGLTEELAVAFNDIDFCMKVRELGKLVVYNPYAELYHYESKSRGKEDTPEKIERFHSEIAYFADRWVDILQDGDPYYNPNLTLDRSDFALKPY